MKLSTATVTVESAEASHGTVPCGFDAEGTAHLMRLLSDLYSNANAAVLREYSVNAHDAHRQAGNPDPIEVTLPTELNPTLVIADHGTGLSRDEVVTVFARYGASTKRGTNDQVGAFGLGSKSAFTLGQQFIVTAVKDGWRTVAAFGLSAAGTGTVAILGHEPAAEANGVTVSISVDSPSEVQRAAGPVFSTWQPGTVLVNGEPPQSVLDDPLQLTDSICLADDPPGGAGTWGDAGLIVVMGNIGYPVSAALRGKLVRQAGANDYPLQTLLQAQRSGQRVFARVGIGDVDIAPSREEMRDTPRTLDRLARIAEDYRQSIAAAVNREIASAPTLTSAARIAAALSRRPHLRQAASRQAALSWRGQPIAHELLVPCTASDYVPERRRCEHKRGSFRLRRDDALDSMLVITDVPADMLERALRAAGAFLRDRDDYRRVVFAPPGAQPAGWFAFGQPDTLPAMPFPDYMADARQRGPVPSASGRPARTAGYTASVGPDGGARELTADEIASLGLPVVVTTSRDDQPGTTQLPAFARAVRDGAVVVSLVGGQTLAALRRRLGPGVSVVTLAERASAVAADVAAAFSEDDAELELAHSCARGVPAQAIARLTALREQVTGPAAAMLNRLHRAAHLTNADAERLSLLIGARAQQPGLFPPAARQPALCEAYPLLTGPVQSSAYQGLSETARSHVVAYLNAITG
jgi:hypothetical protein